MGLDSDMKDDCFCKDKGVIELIEEERREAYAQGWNEGQQALQKEIDLVGSEPHTPDRPINYERD